MVCVGLVFIELKCIIKKMIIELYYLFNRKHNRIMPNNYLNISIKRSHVVQ